MKMFFQLFFATTIISVLPVFATADFVQNDFSIGSSMTSDRYYANSGATVACSPFSDPYVMRV